PYPRGAPPGLPFQWDERTVENGLNFTLVTRLGSLDLFGEVAGGGTYQQLLSDTIVLSIFGYESRSLSLPNLIELTPAPGRAKAFEAIAELELILAAADPKR